MKKQNTWEKLFDEFMNLIEMGLVKTNKGYFHLIDYTYIFLYSLRRFSPSTDIPYINVHHSALRRASSGPS